MNIDEMKAGAETDKPYRCRTCGGNDFKKWPSSNRRYCPACDKKKRFIYNVNYLPRKRELSRLKKASPNFKLYQHKWRISTRYGLSEQRFDEIMTAQNGVCAICGGKPKHQRLNVDHCHKTGIVRGLLCFNCNNGIARFMDDPKIITKALDYLCLPSAEQR